MHQETRRDLSESDTLFMLSRIDLIERMGSNMDLEVVALMLRNPSGGSTLVCSALAGQRRFSFICSACPRHNDFTAIGCQFN
jgi:hypothetical protein